MNVNLLKTAAKGVIGVCVSVILWVLPSPMFQKGKWVADNPVEEKVEEAIKEATGVDVDLTPTSPEKKPRQASQ